MNLFEANQPNGWTRVGDVYEVTKKPRGTDVMSKPSIPFAPMSAIPDTGGYTPAFIQKSPSEIKSGTYFEKGDILVSKITPSFENGKQALTTELQTAFGFATTEVIPLRPWNEEQDRRFLFFYLLHPDVRQRVASRMEGTTGRQRVPTDVLLDVPFPEFDFEEQVSIANLLEVIQRLKSLETASIETANDLKRATMHTLFTRGLRGESQKETEIGPVPESWGVVDFASVREKLQYGTSVRCTYEVSDRPVLRIPNIEPQRVNSKDLKYCALTGDAAAKYELKDGDLIFIRTNGVLDRLGSCVVYDGSPVNALFASYLIRAKLKPGFIVPRFAESFFCSEVGTSIVSERAISASDGKFNLNTAAIDSLLLPLPPTLKEQQEVVEIIDAIDRKIDLHRRKFAVLEELFKALLHGLMTGSIGVGELGLVAIERDGKPFQGR